MIKFCLVSGLTIQLVILLLLFTTQCKIPLTNINIFIQILPKNGQGFLKIK